MRPPSLTIQHLINLFFLLATYIYLWLMYIVVELSLFF